MQPVSKRILIKVAHMYYEADMKQSEIAKNWELTEQQSVNI